MGVVSQVSRGEGGVKGDGTGGSLRVEMTGRAAAGDFRRECWRVPTTCTSNWGVRERGLGIWIT